ncbi:MAG TPA: RNA methyltransferase [Dongiaceae bacterium]|jgi:tRNA/rRNA methyltransferase|nr:RNA methyltransferase [Dongiaceae bacterium]
MSGPAIVLVHPQLGENIGAAARAMLNCGLTDLRLVAPQEGWPNEKARRAAVGAFDLMPPVRLFPATREAVADCTFALATTARERKMTKHILSPRKAAMEIRAQEARGGKVALLFGPERTGLENDDLTLADALVTVPLNPQFSSLNLGQAVLLLAYEYAQGVTAEQPSVLDTNGSPAATKEQLAGFFDHFERALDECGFLRNPTARPSMVRNLRNMWQRAQLTEQEIRTLHGVVKELTTLRQPRKP